MTNKRIIICADHGLAIVYFLQTEVLPQMLAEGVEVILLTDDGLVPKVRERFAHLDLRIEGLRLDLANAYATETWPELQWWLAFLRRVGGSRRINTEAMDSYIDQVAVEESNWRRIWMPMAWAVIGALRRFRPARHALIALQQRFRPGIYGDLFEQFRPDMVVASTPGWRMDRYLLREARARGVRTAAVVVGWDNPSSYSIPGAKVDYITCWSPVQK